ncbi:hypothetical protein WN944_006989 [Citrus x changshan-huyou]|uniref:Uncharacterized protein n=1 Tax=Citrus x changshan-huyou TaxID=2935761 RepID=A0AAP0MQ01_9ROSI
MTKNLSIQMEGDFLSEEFDGKRISSVRAFPRRPEASGSTSSGANFSTVNPNPSPMSNGLLDGVAKSKPSSKGASVNCITWRAK